MKETFEISNVLWNKTYLFCARNGKNVLFKEKFCKERYCGTVVKKYENQSWPMEDQ